ncbi:hypothetical protein SDC9_110185 [bioreactor metagenome]|uniref:Uncharacterized protein n=1 Tax=bioreactor metagenome TaxID=1076179 RepID=A0A645BCX9_9ZZZZ
MDFQSKVSPCLGVITYTVRISYNSYIHKRSVRRESKEIRRKSPEILVNVIIQIFTLSVNQWPVIALVSHRQTGCSKLWSLRVCEYEVEVPVKMEVFIHSPPKIIPATPCPQQSVPVNILICNAVYLSESSQIFKELV